ncbi:MAG TPA: EAL domain-containing protein, partial [Thermoanaerobaculia bacterium]|nr:EAL domain-containing protein [Thermoanaerobaculia bacterium]
VRTLESEVDFAEYLLGELAEQDVSPHRVLIEIVEQSSIEMPARVAHSIRQLRRSGVVIAVDDVGEGFSNHRMLLALRPELLKLDRFIVDGIATDRHRRAIASSLVHLAEGFGGRLVAEGVETLDQLGTLRDLGIDLFQGYLLAYPVRAEEMLQRARAADTEALMTAIVNSGATVRSPEAASDSRTTALGAASSQS